MQFSIGEEAYVSFRRVQELLRREIPSGDPGAIFERAIELLRERVEKAKLAAAIRPRTAAIRPGTDKVHKSALPSRHVPREVKRAVWRRDDGQCAFESQRGKRCSERVFLEFHHIHPYARQGSSTVTNISLRCRRHNQYEAELEFGPRGFADRR
jgi:5-methylcytosine-specific restriction endonuclease McrA